MIGHRTLAIATLFSLLLSGPGLAASTPWFETEGGGIRLVVSGTPTSDGLLLGAVEINLKPGWKTYWRDPGGAGVPFQMSLSGSENVSAHEIGYPAPRRFDDGYSVYAGYKDPVALAVTFTVSDPSKPVAIDAEVFLGICESICIPVQTRFQLVTSGETGSNPDTAIVSMAHAALPQEAGNGLQISSMRQDGDMVIAQVDADDFSDPDLYLINANGWFFGTPEAVRTSDSGLEFKIPVIEKPSSGSDNPVFLEYTLIVGGKSAEGSVQLPE